MYSRCTACRRRDRHSSLPRSASRSALRAARASSSCATCMRIECVRRALLRGSVGREPVGGVGALLGPRSPTVRGVVHVERGIDREGITFVGSTDGSMACIMKTPSPGCCRHTDPTVPQPCSACARAMSDPPPLFPREHDGVGPRARTHSAAAATSRAQSSCRQSCRC
jgi:hypothetical protein